MIPAVAETSEASIDEVKFHYYFFKVTKFSKEWKVWPKTHFLVFVLFVGNFSNKHHYNLLKILRIFCFWYFCPKWLFPELFVLKVDLCTKVVALIKITTVYTKVLKCYFEFIRKLQQKSHVLICLLRGEAFSLCLSCAGGFADNFRATTDPVRVWMSERLSSFYALFVKSSRVDVSETFSADQLWFRILSGLFQRCSLPENLWTTLIQLWTALKTEIFRAKNQRWNSAVQLWNRADSELNSVDFLWNSSETGNFQSKKISAESELFQRWFSLKQSWKTKNPEQGKSTLNQCCFSADFPWKRVDTHWSLLKQLSSFLIFPWDNAEHPETSYSFSANFCRKAQILSFPGNLEIIPLWQKLILFSFRRFIPGNPRSQALWKFRSWSFSANFCGRA